MAPWTFTALDCKSAFHKMYQIGTADTPVHQ